MKYRYLLISFLLHSLLAIPLFLNKTEKIDPIKLIIVSNNTDQKSSEDSNETKDSGSRIVPLGNEDTEQKINSFYWGIGISVHLTSFGGVLAYEVTDVHSGYSADFSGILSGDIIYEIDGKSIVDGKNDIKGNKPRKMILTILRNGAIIHINVERVKVYEIT